MDSVKSSRQPESPVTLARGSRPSSTEMPAGRFQPWIPTRSIDRSTTRTHRDERWFEISSPCSTRPAVAADLTSHDASRGTLRREHETEAPHRGRAPSCVPRNPEATRRCQPKGPEPRDDPYLDTHRDEWLAGGLVRVWEDPHLP